VVADELLTLLHDAEDALPTIPPSDSESDSKAEGEDVHTPSSPPLPDLETEDGVKKFFPSSSSSGCDGKAVDVGEWCFDCCKMAILLFDLSGLGLKSPNLLSEEQLEVCYKLSCSKTALLEGPAGSGKTLVAGIVMLLSVLRGQTKAIVCCASTCQATLVLSSRTRTLLTANPPNKISEVFMERVCKGKGCVMAASRMVTNSIGGAISTGSFDLESRTLAWFATKGTSHEHLLDPRLQPFANPALGYLSPSLWRVVESFL